MVDSIEITSCDPKWFAWFGGGDRLLIGSTAGHFYVLDLATGKKLWDFEAGATLSAFPAITAGRAVKCTFGTAPVLTATVRQR